MAHKDLLNSVYVTRTFRINAVTIVMTVMMIVMVMTMTMTTMMMMMMTTLMG